MGRGLRRGRLALGGQSRWAVVGFDNGVYQQLAIQLPLADVSVCVRFLKSFPISPGVERRGRLSLVHNRH